MKQQLFSLDVEEEGIPLILYPWSCRRRRTSSLSTPLILFERWRLSVLITSIDGNDRIWKLNVDLRIELVQHETAP